ncbi:putative signal peptide protein [Puccinia sorghi]|uniref:Putative signal peptide protein n=1 Tax=Puccinia sorghi TaxID=27349 RepID=A0A0L6V279_9BASI|nr:putative signal peptide protein [Puccinia sorghi]
MYLPCDILICLIILVNPISMVARSDPRLFYAFVAYFVIFYLEIIIYYFFLLLWLLVSVSMKVEIKQKCTTMKQEEEFPMRPPLCGKKKFLSKYSPSNLIKNTPFLPLFAHSNPERDFGCSAFGIDTKSPRALPRTTPPLSPQLSPFPLPQIPANFRSLPPAAQSLDPLVLRLPDPPAAPSGRTLVRLILLKCPLEPLKQNPTYSPPAISLPPTEVCLFWLTKAKVDPLSQTKALKILSFFYFGPPHLSVYTIHTILKPSQAKEKLGSQSFKMGNPHHPKKGSNVCRLPFCKHFITQQYLHFYTQKNTLKHGLYTFFCGCNNRFITELHYCKKVVNNVGFLLGSMISSLKLQTIIGIQQNNIRSSAWKRHLHPPEERRREYLTNHLQDFNLLNFHITSDILNLRKICSTICFKSLSMIVGTCLFSINIRGKTLFTNKLDEKKENFSFNKFNKRKISESGMLFCDFSHPANKKKTSFHEKNGSIDACHVTASWSTSPGPRSSQSGTLGTCIPGMHSWVAEFWCLKAKKLARKKLSEPQCKTTNSHCKKKLAQLPAVDMQLSPANIPLKLHILVESLLEHGWSNNRSFLGVSACQLQVVEQRSGPSFSRLYHPLNEMTTSISPFNFLLRQLGNCHHDVEYNLEFRIPFSNVRVKKCQVKLFNCLLIVAQKTNIIFNFIQFFCGSHRIFFFLKLSFIPPENSLLCNFKLFSSEWIQYNSSSYISGGLKWFYVLAKVDIHMLYPLVGRYVSMCSCFVKVNIMNTSCTAMF